MGFVRSLFKKTDYRALMDRGAVIIDVRSKEEFQDGHIEKSQNIPLDSLGSHIPRLKKLNVPVVACCVSGMRSGIAKNTLKKHGIEAYNGGGWASLNNKI